MKRCKKFTRPEGYETVAEKVRAIAKKMNGIGYLFENWHTANVRIDSKMLPVMLNVLPVTGTIRVDSQLRDYPNCLFAFMDKVELDANGDDANSVVERCKAYAEEFILRLNQSGMFEPISGEVRYSVFYDRLDVNVAGVTIEVTLRERSGIVLCPGKSVENTIYGITD